ncbi:hypothetical protein PDESU_06153 [Pontiella desulfatans]|uniref:Staphylococcus aureus surface protein A n=1 Tax=Pontiella desulfatans TaxID=2750659 RepID=A0A6C2UEB5_PONDE|nr:DUF5060 domain-containing protein [Pontiella desulfatans]VGO17556.1 hypothetical protein PDESU_06153 [Pontiella desulfatans]
MMRKIGCLLGFMAAFAITSSVHASTYTYGATTDFTNLSSGEVPYYKHTAKNALAIDAATEAYRNKFAKARVVFNGTAGTYNLALTALKELDGECSYRLSVNGTLVGSRTNQPTTTDYEPQDHYFNNVHLPAGAIIEVESNCTSNEQVPENGGWAYARGRWTALTLSTTPAVDAGGELKRWHKVTLTLDGPDTSETATPNPFTDYRMNVEFTHRDSGKTYLVPGYFAADGDAANSGATAGNKWRAHLAPDLIGTWDYTVLFRSGSNVATDLGEWAGATVFPYNGTAGSFSVAETDKGADDFRTKGRLVYDGSRYLKHAATGGAFIKTGADAPENFLNYLEFDNTYTHTGTDYRRDWADHVADWQTGDPTWKSGLGKGIVGAINYLASEGQNVFSFLTYNAGGDSKDVWPFTSHTNPLVYDCSKLDQWEIVFRHGQNKGMYLHFKMQERENDNHATWGLDAGALGTERKLYCRELVARFGHHLALNWNIGEENDQTTQQVKDMMQYIKDLDPYGNHIVLHTYPNEWEAIYRPLLGTASEQTGVSLQCNYAQVHSRTLQWINESTAAGKPWVVANDEQGPANYANPPDSVTTTTPSQAQMRKNVVWGNLMAGGGGVELYAGYQNPHSDLTLTDFRSRDRMWDYCRFAKQFFNDHLLFSRMWNMNSLIGNTGNGNDKYCFGKTNEKYAIFLANGGTTSIDLSAATGTFKVWWFDPRNGGALQAGSVAQVSGGASRAVGSAPGNTGSDWAVLICRAGEENVGEGSVSIVPSVSVGADSYIILPTNEVTIAGSATDQDGTIASYLWSQESGPNNATLAGATTINLTASGLVKGDYLFKLTATDNDGGTGSDSIRISVLDPADLQDPTADGGPNKTIQLPVGQIVFNGSADDDSHYSIVWTQVSGPLTASLGGQGTTSLTASGLSQQGDYVFQIEVTDIQGNVATDQVQVKVLPLGVDGAWIEKDGIVVMEAEHGDLVSNWVARPTTHGAANAMAGSLGDGWLEWTGAQFSGNTKTEAQVNGIITYKFKITTAGDYFFRWRSKQYDNVASGDAGNDTFVSLNSGTPVSGYQDFGDFHKVWVQSQAAWSWRTTFEPVHGTHYSDNNVRRHYEPGIHTIKLAARSPGHSIDRMVLFRTSISFNETTFNNMAESQRDGGGNPIVDAGIDQTLFVPASTATLEGSAEDSDDGTIAGVQWAQVSGPTSIPMAGETNATLQLTGLVEGTYVFELTATDDEGKTGSDEVVVEVIDDRFPKFVTTSLPAGEVNSAYDQTIAIQYGQAPFTWSIASGSLPPGLNFGNGRISGTPTVDGTFNVTVRVDDADGDARQKAFALVIDEESFEETKTFNVVHDAYIQGTTPFNTSELKIEANNRVAYLQFDVSGISDDVVSAQLSLTCAGDAGSGTIRLYKGSHNTWTETTLTDANKPATGAEVGSMSGSFALGTTYEFDVTSLLDGDGTYTLVAKMDSGGNDAWFSSKEGATAPKLTVVYNKGSTTPPPPSVDYVLFEEPFTNTGYATTINGSDWNPKWEEGTDQQNLLGANGQYAVLDTSVAQRNYHAPSKHGFALSRDGDKAVISSDFRYFHEAGGNISTFVNKAAFGFLLGVSPNWHENGGNAFTLCNRGAAVGVNGTGENGVWVEGWVPHAELGIDTAAGGTSDWFSVELTVERGASNYVRHANIILDGTVRFSTATQELGTIANGETIYAGYTTGWSSTNASIGAFSKIPEVNMDNFRIEVLPFNTPPVFLADPIDGGSVDQGTAYAGSLTNAVFDVEGDALTFSATGPAWLAVSTNGALSGMPTASDIGENSFEVSVVDAADNTNTATLVIVVTDGPPPLVLESLWSEDFEGAAPGASTSGNATLPGTDIQTANQLTGMVVAAPVAFSNASGQVALLSSGGGSWAGVRPVANPIDLTAYNIQPGDRYQLAFDIYIPASLGEAVGGILFRWKDDANTGNGPFDYTQAKLAAGQHHIVYTGSFPVDTGAGDFVPDHVYPIIYFDQEGVAATNHVYLDNLEFKVGTPSAIVMSDYTQWAGTVGLPPAKVNPTLDVDGDGLTNMEEYLSGFNPLSAASVFAVEATQTMDESGEQIVLEWESKENRVYSITQSPDLISGEQTVVEDNILYPQNSHTVDVSQAESGFLKVNVRLH